MQTHYDTFSLNVLANQELTTTILTGRPDYLPYFVAFGRSLTADTSFLLYLNSMLVIDVPHSMQMGYDNFLPWYHQLQEGDVIRAGFRNSSGAPLDLDFVVQYVFL